MNDLEKLHKTLKNSLSTLNSIINELDLPKQVSKNSLSIYKLLIAKKLTRGRNRSEILGASIYIVSQAVNYPVDIKKLCQASDCTKKGLIRQQKFIKKFIDIKNNLTPEQYINKFTYLLGLNEAVKTKALKEVSNIKEQLINSTPEIIASVSIYLNSDKSIREIARVTGVSKNAISSNARKSKTPSMNQI